MDKTISYFKQDCYLAFDKEGNTQIVHEVLDLPLYRHAFIRINYEHPPQIPLFTDPTFSLQQLRMEIPFLCPERVVLKRIADLRPLGSPLFPQQTSNETVLQFNPQFPHFVYQLRHFDYVRFKRLFLTQTVTENGMYEVLVNRQGTFQVQVVDDYIPIRDKENDHIWGLKHPWQWIIAKVWAKKTGSYHNVKTAKPFDFIQTFTPCHWRYFNLTIEGRQFLKNYCDKVGKDCRILLKTKQEQIQNQIETCGLVSGALIYQLIEMCRFREKDKQKQEHHVFLKSLVAHQWTGSLSIFDPDFEHFFPKLKSKNLYQLSTSFLMNSPDFFNIFAAAYVAPIKQKYPQFIDSCSLTPKDTCLQFQVLTSGYLVFNFRQSLDNDYSPRTSIVIRPPVDPKYKNQHQNLNYNCKGKYMKVKYILARVRETTLVSRLIGSEKQIQGDEDCYQALNYELIDFDYSKGCGKGDAHPIQIKPGRYFFKVQIQQAKREPSLNLQYICHQRIKIIHSSLNQKQQRILLEQSILSISHQVPSQPLRCGFIAFGREFQSLGYDFVAVRMSKRKKGRLAVKIDHKKLQQQGYIFLNEKRNQKEQTIEIRSGEDRVFFLEKIKERRSEEVWPPKAFRFFEDK